jgi:putative NADH-flavin reductase
MNIIVFGASGKTGHHLVRQALEQGHSVIAFVRNPAKLLIKHDRLKILQGDIMDALKTEQAIKKHDAVLLAAIGHLQGILRNNEFRRLPFFNSHYLFQF